MTDLRLELKMNIACKEAIEEAISNNYSDNRLSSKNAVTSVLERFTKERVQYVLANTIQHKNFDGRISEKNKKWAKTIDVCQENSTQFIIDSVNPGLTDLFVTEFIRQKTVVELDRYFYSIELDEQGNKVMHLSGNVYCNDVDETESNFRIAEWTFCYIPINEAKRMIEDDMFFEYVNERVAYLTNITETEAEQCCKNFFDGKSGEKLHISDISDDTPCGDYWFE